MDGYWLKYGILVLTHENFQQIFQVHEVKKCHCDAIEVNNDFKTD